MPQLKSEPLNFVAPKSVAAARAGWMKLPDPEPVFSYVQPAAAIDAFAASAAATRLPAFTLEAEPLPLLDTASKPPAPCQTPARAPEPDPVFSFVQPAAALAEIAAPAALRLPELAKVATRIAPPAVFGKPMRAPEPEPVFSFVQPAAALEALAAPPAAIQLPSFQAEIEPEPVFDEMIEPPAPCETWMRSPEAEPVFTYLQAASAAQVAMAARAPSFDSFAVVGPYLPKSAAFSAPPTAEPVMSGVWPQMANIQFGPIYCNVPVHLPQFPGLATEQAAPPIQAVQPASAQPAERVESFLVANRSTLPLAASHTPLLAAQAPVLPVAPPAPHLAGPATGPAPEPLESLLAASSAVQMESATVVRLQPFAVAASEERTVPGFDAPRLAPAVSKPPAAAAKLTVLKPISTVRVTVPAPVPQRPMPAIPKPGLLQLEFHAQRVRGTAAPRLEWKGSRYKPVAPSFSLRTVWEKNEDVPGRTSPEKKPVALFALKGKKTVVSGSAFTGYALKIAASIFVFMATWYGMGSLRNRVLLAQKEVSDAAPRITGSNTPGKAAPGTHTATASDGAAPAAAPPPKGVVTRFRETIARRAAVQYNDNLREGMEAWGATAKTYPAGWSRNSDGYVRTGTMALFSPSLGFTDYRMEFFGQIESKSIGWTVRAKDAKNYHAMKFTVIEKGLRPVIAMVHYNVVDGRTGRKYQTPLNVMVHNNRPFQVAVNVKGNTLTTSIDGEEVDSFSDTILATGGIGFFSEAGEKARLYWVKVSKNDDLLGHVCAFLSGVNGSSVTAEVWGPDSGAPAPGLPDSDRASLAGAWLAFPHFGASRRARLAKSRRLQPWNS
jgi:hypothetical protein